jgi:AcrR family transcriptional regulator
MTEIRTADTRERILNAGERLFMAHGYEGTSMRQITSEASVNLAAVNYHFGSKESLMQEVFRRRLDWLNEERMRVLGEMEREAAGKPLKPSQIVDGFFGTLLRMADDEERGGVTFLRLLGRTLTEPSEFIRTFLAHEYATVMDRYKEALFKALPDVPKADIVWRFHFMLGATSYAIAGTDALRLVTDWQIEEADAVDRVDRLVPRLMSFLLGGLRAPLPQYPDVAVDAK